ncbi:MAG: 16S rRNA (cytidine(1402)-2'-O)-methyltransferase [Mycoplasmoidaceae bacterium]
MNNFYIIATPIGNINEINNRAKEAISSSKIFLCEDTRVTKKLLNNLNIPIIDKKFIICNEFSESSQIDKILKYLEKENCVLMSDAGYPMISDPGYIMKKYLNSNNITPIIINGSCSIMHALLLSDYPLNNFYFNGFLNKKKQKRIQELFKLKKINSTLVLFESVHNLLETLDDIKHVFGDIQINVCKELTKKNETKYSGKISEIISQIDLRGEFVIVFQNELEINEDINSLLFEIIKLEKKGTKTKEACKMVAYKYNIKANSLYDLYMEKKVK